MSLALQRLVYESTATGSTDSVLNIAGILGASQANNDRDALTGALAAHEGRFLQVVEGAASALDRLLRRLEHDPRHRDIVILDRSPIAARQFGQWAMASARITPAMAPALNALMAEPQTNPAALVSFMRDVLTVTQDRAA